MRLESYSLLIWCNEGPGAQAHRLSTVIGDRYLYGELHTGLAGLLQTIPRAQMLLNTTDDLHSMWH